eukprot:s234_g2.t1
MKYYENLQTRLHDGTVGDTETPAQASSDPSASSTKQPRRGNGRKSDHDCFAPRDTGVQAQMKGKKINLAFMTATPLSDIQDRYEGGARLVNGVLADDLGPKNKKQLDYVVNRTCLLTRVDELLPTVAELVDNAPNQWSRNRGYAKINVELPEGLVCGRLSLARARGEPYLGRSWLRPHVWNDSWIDLDDTEKTCSHRLNMVLRHRIGVVRTPRGFPGLKCDEGCWVNILDVLIYNWIWDDGYELSLDSLQEDVLAERMTRMSQLVWYEVKARKTVRFQIVGPNDQCQCRQFDWP